MERTDSGKHKTSADPLIGQLVAGKWRVIGRLDDGGRSRAYRVERVPTGEAALLNLAEESLVLARGDLARFDREARIASQVKHARISAILDFGAWNDRPYLVSELLKGKRLSDVIGTDEMTVRRAVTIAAQMLEGARHLHAHGVVHRDLTPEGVVLLDSPVGEQVKLSPPGLGLTTGGAPAEPRGDHRGDLQAVGRVLYAMCVGRAPNVQGAIEEPRRAAPEREIGEALEGTILKATAPQPAFRFQSAEDFLNALARAEGMARPAREGHRARATSLGSVAGAAGTAGKPWPKVKIAWGVAALVAIGGAGIVLSSARTGRRAAPLGQEESDEVAARAVAEAPRSGVPPAGEAAPTRPPAPAPAPAPPPAPPPVPAPAPRPAPPSVPAPAPPRAPASASAAAAVPAPAPPPFAPTARVAPGAAGTTIAQAQPVPPKPPATPPALTSARPSPPTAPSPKASPPPPPLPPPSPPTRPPATARQPPSPAPLVARADPTDASFQPVRVVDLVPITEVEKAEVMRLIAAHDSVHASEKITALMQRDPRVAWPHVALAELHFRNLWRRDVVRQWQIALHLDPTLKEDPLLTRHLCLAQDPKWKAAGLGDLLAELGEQGTALLSTCPSSTAPASTPTGGGGAIGADGAAP